jgi:cell division septal protein FtsQ
MAATESEDLSLEELDAGEGSPYLRRSKAIGVRRGRFTRRARRLLSWAMFSLLALLPAGFAGYELARFALGSPAFQIISGADVTISGNRYVSPEQILDAAGVPVNAGSRTGINIFRISLWAEAKRVETIPWVKSAAVVRAFPHRLAIYVTERVPVAFADIGDRIKLVDADGVLLDNPGKTTFDFPVLRGLDAEQSASDRAQRVGMYCDFMRETAAEMPRSGWMVSEVRLKDPDDLQALLVQGSETLRVHFGRRDFLRRFRNFLALLPELEKHSAKISSVDLRYGNQVVVEPSASEGNQPGRGTAPPPGGGGL